MKAMTDGLYPLQGGFKRGNLNLFTARSSGKSIFQTLDSNKSNTKFGLYRDFIAKALDIPKEDGIMQWQITWELSEVFSGGGINGKTPFYYYIDEVTPI